MSMRIGIITSDFKNPGALSADELFYKIKKRGFEVVQLCLSSVLEMGFFGTGQFEIPDRIDADAVKAIYEASQRHGLPIVICGGTFNMAHPDARVREEGIRRFELVAGMAKNLGCGMVSLCSGTRYERHLWTYHQDNDSEAAWADMADTMGKVARIAERHGITAAIETEASNVVNTPEKARRIMDEVNSPNLKMIMDCANLFHVGEAKKENVHGAVSRAFGLLGNDVVLAHGKDIAESEGIAFCPTGEGIIDFGQFVELLGKYGYTGDMVLHGIYDENKMEHGINTIKKYMR